MKYFSALTLFLCLIIVANANAGSAVKQVQPSQLKQEKIVTDNSQDLKSYLQQIFKEIKGKKEFRLQIEDVASRGQAIVPSLSEVLHNVQADWQERWFSAMALAHIGGQKAEAELQKGLKDSLFIVRLAAIKGLIKMSSKNLAEQLRPMVQDQAMVVRSEVASSLAKLKDQQAVKPLAAELHREINFYHGRSLPIRGRIVAALGELANKEAIPCLIRELERADKQLHSQTMLALAAIVDKAGFKTKPKELNNSQSWIDWWQARKIQ